jgi:hypothetical protein
MVREKSSSNLTEQHDLEYKLAPHAEAGEEVEVAVGEVVRSLKTK